MPDSSESSEKPHTVKTAELQQKKGTKSRVEWVKVSEVTTSVESDCQEFGQNFLSVTNIQAPFKKWSTDGNIINMHVTW